MIDVRVLPDAASLADVVAGAFLELVGQAPEATTGPQVHEVALTGGSIADQVHLAIAAAAPGAGVEWRTVRFWWGDERFVAATSSDRNAVQARRALLDRLAALGGSGLPEDNVVEVPAAGSVRDVDAAAEVYADLLRHEGTGEFELTMLGLGPDGHIASLFPHHPGLSTTDAITVAVTDSPKPPPQRVSLTLEALNRSRQVWFLVAGENKAAAVARSVAAQRAGTGTIADTPAYGIGHPDHLRPGAEPPAVTWWLDEAAASALP
ncbi:MAG: 6-phosphogluconolactonase [Nocardioides sp.]|nr:6-phosphogluconolactonase [Nocardioides sp.]